MLVVVVYRTRFFCQTKRFSTSGNCVVVVVYRTRFKKKKIYIYFWFLFPVRWSVNEFVIMGSLIKMVIVPRRDSSRQRGNEWQSKDVCWETGLRLIKLVGFHLIHYSAR